MIDDQNEVVFCKKPPAEVEIVTLGDFTNALVEGCKQVICSFAKTSDNKDVYAFNLYTDEHKFICVYMNTLSYFENTLAKYQDRYENYYEQHEIQSLKYNSGDFDLQFGQDHMGEYGRYVTQFETIAYCASDIDKEHAEQAMEGVPVVAFEAGIIEDGYYVCAIEAMQRLVNEDAFNSLDKTDNFIAYASTGEDGLDYDIVMRKTIDANLYYLVFPEMKESDEKFDEAINESKHLTVSDAISYWTDIIHNNNSLEPSFTYIKPTMEIFVQLERFGSELAQECLDKLTELPSLENLDNADYEKIGFYIEALYFCGSFTPEQMKQCVQIEQRFLEGDDILIECANELKAIVSG
ncbi:DUF4303 domain-containing protein [Paenibacillus sinopodophylli]|uniref:DUF4303 domain-containing protein n=1 Tax=Paenibacillus sinopodophylli TaxID=1837342 RepID=UPI0014864259|nr:DUF4303 domain-containing protein [Paenibacillus sinopodophylli]